MVVVSFVDLFSNKLLFLPSNQITFIGLQKKIYKKGKCHTENTTSVNVYYNDF